MFPSHRFLSRWGRRFRRVGRRGAGPLPQLESLEARQLMSVSLPLEYTGGGESLGEFGGNAKLTVTDMGAAITLSLKGAGEGELFRDAQGLHLVVDEADATTQLAVKSKNGDAVFRNIFINGDIKSISGKTLDVTNDLIVSAGLGTLKMDDFSGTGRFIVLDAITPVNVTADQWSVRSSSIGGAGVGTVKLNSLSDAAWAAASFGKVTLKGNATQSHLLAGANFGMDDVLGGDDDTFVGGTLLGLNIKGSATGLIVGAGLDPMDNDFRDLDVRVLGGAASAMGPVSIKGPVDATSRFGAGAFNMKGLNLGGTKIVGPAFADPRVLLNPVAVPFIDLLASSDSGVSPTDNITNDTTPTIRVKASPGNTVTLLLNGVASTMQVAPASGDVDVTLPMVADGVYSLTATATDGVVNRGPGDPLMVTIDTVAPAVPGISLDPSTDTGVSNTDMITNLRDPIVVVTTTPGDFVELFIFDITYDTIQATPTAIFPLIPLVHGLYNLDAIAFDLAGNTSTLPAQVFMTIDEFAPTTPTLTLNSAFDSLPLGDLQTEFASVTLDGTTDAGTLVELFRGMTLLGSTTSNGSGAFSFTNVALNLGDNALTARAMDTAGNTSSIAVTFRRLDNPVDFGDADLAAAVRGALGLPADYILTEPDLADLTHLTADSNLISSLQGLEAAVNLVSLRLFPSDYAMPGALDDLSPLAALDNLTELVLQRAGLEAAELPTLGTPAMLQSLDLRYNNLTDLDDLPVLPALESLFVYGNLNLDPTNWAGMEIPLDLTLPDVSRADTIAELADALLNQPLAMYQHVLNYVEYEPYQGAMKGPQATLETLAGNAWDQASLLAELLGEAGVATRYVFGRIDVPVQEVMDWLSVTDPDAAGLVLANAGLDPLSFIDGFGDPVSIEFDHTWLEADLFQLDGSTQTYELDPSWKFKFHQPGVGGLAGLVPFDEMGYLSQVTQEMAFEYYENQVQSYLTLNMPGTSIADVFYDGPIIPQLITAPPSSLPYDVAATYIGYPVMDIPQEFTHRVQVQLYSGITPILDQMFSLPEMSLSRLTVDYADAGGGLLTPRLLLDGAAVETSLVDVLNGSPVTLVLTHFDADGGNGADRLFQYERDAGQHIAIGLDARQSSHNHIVDLRQAVNNAAIGQINGEMVANDELIGSLLNLAVTQWFFDTNRAEDIVDGLTEARGVYNYVASGITSSETTFTIHPDLQFPIVPDALNIDIANNFNQSFSIVSDDSFDVMRERLIGHNSSALEHAVWEELVHTQSISTIKSLQIAGDMDIPVFVFDNSDSEAEIRNALNLDPATEDAIVAEVDMGQTVTVPRDPTPLQDWDGVGYITEGSQGVGYIIFGGLNTQSNPTALRASRGGSTTGGPDAIFTIDPLTGEWTQFHAGDPVNIANGNVKHDELDIALPGVGVPLTFGRYYDSLNTDDRGMGPGWSFTYSDRLEFDGDDVTWLDAMGNRFLFTSDGLGGFIVGESIYGTFSDTGTEFVWQDKRGMTRTFDTTGKLIEMADRYGNGYSIAYDGSDQITTVSDLVTPSRNLTFTHTGGLVTSVADFTGRTWTYTYDGGRLAQAAAPTDADTLPAVMQYDYFSDVARNGLLQQVTHPDGGTVQYDYYANGRGFQVTDPEGYSHAFYFDILRDRTFFTDERGHVTTYMHNDEGNLVGVVHPDRAREAYVWQDSLMTAWTDAMGETETYEYDALGNLTRSEDRRGNETLYVYEPMFSNNTSVTRPGGRVTTMTYDAAGNLTELEDAVGNITTMTHDARGQVLTMTMPRGNLTPAPGDFTRTFTYDAAGKLLTRATDLPTSESWTYSPQGTVLTWQDATGHTTSYEYDLLNRTIGRTDALNQMASSSYDAMGNLVSDTDELSRVTGYEYDLRRRPLSITLADTTRVESVYDETGRLVVTADTLGRQVFHVYDARSRRVAEVRPDGGVTLFGYDGQGRLNRATDGLGRVTTYAHDAEGRATTVTDPHGEIGTRTYDEVGNVSTVTDPLGRTTTYSYDLLNRLTATTDPLGHTSVRAYDAHNNIVSITDPLGHATTFGFDVLDRLVSQTDADARTSTTTYNVFGDPTSLTDPEGNVTSYAYDALHRKTSVTNALGDTRTFTYDAVGHRTGMTDRNGREIEYAHDTIGRLQSETWLDSLGDPLRVTQMLYDAAGQIVLAVDPDSTHAYAYDALGRTVFDSNGGTPGVSPTIFTYTYNTQGNLLTMSDSHGGLQSYTYDDLNRTTRVTQSGTGVAAKRVDLAYDDASQLTGLTRYSNLAGTALVANSAFTYDGEGRLTALAHTRNATTIAQYAWSFDNGDRLIQMNTPDGVTTYTYEDSNQLTSADHSFQSDETYTYDDNGNRTNAGYSTGLNNQTLSDGLFDYTYDAEGNRTSRTEIATDIETVYEWDHRNRLTRVSTFNASDDLIADVQYTYDAFNRRIAKEVDSDGDGPAAATTDHFVYSGQNILLQFNEAGTQTHRYFHGPGTDQIWADEASGNTRWALTDHQGSVRDIVNNTGVVQNHIRYDSFGNVTAQTNPAASTLFGFTGRELDTETGLNYYRARYYDALVGRFVSEDPIGFQGNDTNLSRYVRNNPALLVDPLGLAPQTFMRAATPEEIRGFNTQPSQWGPGNWLPPLTGVWPGYNFMGPGWTDRNAIPVNQLDQYAYDHDMAYERLGVGGPLGALFDHTVLEADITLAWGAWGQVFTWDNSWTEIGSAGLAATLFTGVSGIKTGIRTVVVVGGAVVDGVQYVGGGIVSGVEYVGSGIASGVETVGTGIYNGGAYVIEGTGNAIHSAATGTYDVFATAWNYWTTPSPSSSQTSAYPAPTPQPAPSPGPAPGY